MGTLLCSVYIVHCVCIGLRQQWGLGGEQGYIYDDMFLSVFVFFTGHG
jgi:hypothetical protein